VIAVVMGEGADAPMVNTVSAVTLGTLGLPGLEPVECDRLLRTALELGVTAFDTADVYGDGESERRLGNFVHSRRDQLFVSTKIGRPFHGERISAASVRARLEASLVRLQTDHVDVCHIHMPDPNASGDEIMGALDDLRVEGKVGASGWSNYPPEMMVADEFAADAAGRPAPGWVQTQYSMIVRRAEAGIFPVVRKLGKQVQVWGPLASGWLTSQAASSGKPVVSAQRAATRPGSFDLTRPGNERKAEVVRQLAELAAQWSLSLSHLAIAFALEHPAVTTLISGADQISQLEDCVQGTSVRLPSELIDAVDAIVAPGSVVNPDDIGWQYPEIRDSSLRRRSAPRPLTV
jgi:aryl-alcohol dehydrogenase-like predicted oxidoreductase